MWQESCVVLSDLLLLLDANLDQSVEVLLHACSHCNSKDVHHCFNKAVPYLSTMGDKKISKYDMAISQDSHIVSLSHARWGLSGPKNCCLGASDCQSVSTPMVACLGSNTVVEQFRKNEELVQLVNPFGHALELPRCC